MSNLSAVEAKLPPGFRFHPRDEELICDYLMKKVTCASDLHPLMIQVDLNKCEPWDIPETALVGGKECYFYSQRDRKYATGLRTNRATASGYWKATGKDRPVLRNGTLVGMRKTLVFYQGRAPKGRKTDWVMHEFRLEGPFTPANLSTSKEDWVLCRVLLKNRDEVTKDTGSSSSGRGGGDTSPSSTSRTPYITYSSDQISHPNNMNDTYNQLQVSASFSIFTVPPPNDHHDHDQINQQNSNIIPTFSYLSHMENNNFLPNNNSFGGLGTDFGISYNNEEKKGIKYHVLSSTESNYPPPPTHHHHHVIKGGSSSSFGGNGSSDTFFIHGGATF